MMTQGYAALFSLTHWFNARPCPTPRETAPRRERELLKSLALIEEPLLGRSTGALRAFRAPALHRRSVR